MQSQLSTLNVNLDGLVKSRDCVEIDPDDHLDAFDDMLDECEGEFMGIQASRILKECDPIAHRCGLLDYCDGLDVADCEEYTDLQGDIDDLENEISEIEQSI